VAFFILLILLVAAYYVAHGRKFLSLDRVAEPSFIFNATYLLNFPMRALVWMFIGDEMEAAPAMVWDIDRCNAALLYSTACMLVFNFSYEYFRHRDPLRAASTATSLQPLQPISGLMMSYFALLGLIVLYFRLTSKTNIDWSGDIVSDIPLAIGTIQFALDASIIGSLILFLRTRRLEYLVAFAFFFGGTMYEAFLLTAKYAVFAYLVIILLIMKRLEFMIRFRHLVLIGLVVIPFTISSYLIRDYELLEISPESTLVSRVMLLENLLAPLDLWGTFVDQFVLTMTNRFVYLDTFMLYLHAINDGIALDLYDRLGSLPTYKTAIPSIFGVDKSTVENIHVWYANKYWYGTPPDTWGVVIPFGRIVESFMVFRWGGSLSFVFYGWLFAMLYTKLFCSTNPLLVIYCCFLFYNSVLVDDVLLFHFRAILDGTILLFGSMWAFKQLRLRPAAI
jgi:hypothetical protein